MDDLLDLDWSKNADQSKAGNVSTGRNTYNSATSSYNFDALTRSMPTSQPGLRPQSRTSTPTATSASVKSNNTGADAFSSLLGFSGTPPSSSTTTSMSMADRLKQSSSLGYRQANPPPKVESSAWDGLDDFMTGSSSSRVAATTSKTQKEAQAPDNLWEFDTKQAKLGSAADIRPTKPTQKVSSSEARNDAFDFSEFEDPGASQSSALGGGTVDEKINKSTPSGNVFDDNSFDDDAGDDSVLGSLARPARPLASAVEDRTWQRETRQPAKPLSRSGAASPPPHIIGQVVEMGFSPTQAREALLATDGGQNVAAAIEMLLQNAKTEKQQRRQNGLDEDEERDHLYALRVQQEENARRRPGSGQGGARPDHLSVNNGAETPTEWQKQADQLYAQASEIGANVFSRANALWASAKTQAQKALDEHNIGPSSSNASSGRSSPASGSDRARNRRWAVPSRDGGARRDWQGKPKWMLDAEQEDESPAAASKPVKSENGSSQFKDDDDLDAVKEAPAFVAKHKAPSTSSRHQSPVPQPQAVSLWPNRAEQVVKQAPSPVIRPSQAKVQAPKAGPVVTAAPKARTLTQDDLNAIQASARHRQRGNESFKRGAYGEAEAAYSLALDALQTNLRSVRRIAVLNNRANARIKNGDAKGALDDTLAVLRIIVVQENERSSPFLLYRPSQEAPLPLPEYAEINLRDGYAKALLRRAQAEEQLERWDPALSVWSLLEKYEREEGSGTNGVSNLRAAQDGKGRCNKMLKGGAVNVEDKVAQRPPVVNPRVRAAAARAVAKAEAQAKERIRSENAAAAAEEAKKDTLRDSVDVRILAWKTGKENNVRALLASLHDVVWPGLAWKRVGMHELVMDNQVKKCYMRAIGKLHPDKLTPRNNTIEERMIGGAVFSVLNEAYASANV